MRNSELWMTHLRQQSVRVFFCGVVGVAKTSVFSPRSSSYHRFVNVSLFQTTKDKRLILQLYFAANQTCRRSTFHIVTLVQPLDPNTNVGISGNVLFFFQLINTSQPTAKMNLQRYNECCATVQCHYAWLMSYVLTVFVKGQFKSVAVIVTIFTSLNQLSSEPEAFLWEMHI